MTADVNDGSGSAGSSGRGMVWSALHRLGTGAAGRVPHDLRVVLAAYGGSLACADQVLSLAEPPSQVEQ